LSQFSKEWGFSWWGTAGCASRGTFGFITRIGVEDLVDENGDPISSGNHHQGVIKGSEGFPIICNSRNPYTRVLATFLDYKAAEEYREFESFVEECASATTDFSEHYENEWDEIGVEPTYKIRMEHLAEDVWNITPFLKAGEEKIRGAVADCFENNLYANENKYDKYIKSPNGVMVQDCKPYYNERTAKIVYEGYKKVFDFFGYERDSWLL